MPRPPSPDPTGRLVIIYYQCSVRGVQFLDSRSRRGALSFWLDKTRCGSVNSKSRGPLISVYHCMAVRCVCLTLTHLVTAVTDHDLGGGLVNQSSGVWPVKMKLKIKQIAARSRLHRIGRTGFQEPLGSM